MKFVVLLVCVFSLVACNVSGQYSPQYGVNAVSAQNQYIPVIVSDTGSDYSVPVASLCTSKPYVSYSNSPKYCGYTTVILP